jgi:hypothetical protein
MSSHRNIQHERILEKRRQLEREGRRQAASQMYKTKKITAGRESKRGNYAMTSMDLLLAVGVKERKKQRAQFMQEAHAYKRKRDLYERGVVVMKDAYDKDKAWRIAQLLTAIKFKRLALAKDDKRLKKPVPTKKASAYGEWVSTYKRCPDPKPPAKPAGYDSYVMREYNIKLATAQLQAIGLPTNGIRKLKRLYKPMRNRDDFEEPSVEEDKGGEGKRIGFGAGWEAAGGVCCDDAEWGLASDRVGERVSL